MPDTSPSLLAAHFAHHSLPTATYRLERKRGAMKNFAKILLPFAAAAFLTVGCQNQPAKSPDVKDSVKSALEQAGYRDVSVSQDRDKGVITLTGTVLSDSDKAQAESIAKSAAAGDIVSNQIGVRPPGNEGTAKDVQSDLDKAIDKNVDAVLLQHKWNHDVSYDVKNGVVTLKGKVHSQTMRTTVEKVVARVPNVQQVVNLIDVTDQKATSTH
jgi:hyperosmotically inducible periplasmic protein